VSGLRTATPIFLGPVEEVEGGCGRGGVPVSDGAQAGGEGGGAEYKLLLLSPLFRPPPPVPVRCTLCALAARCRCGCLF